MKNETVHKRLSAVIADDEPLARAYLKELLLAHPEIEIRGEAANGLQTVETVLALKPDLLFLDIQMPKLDGFEVLQALERDAPQVIFVTAFDEYAIKAFEVHAVDYLLKPFPAKRLKSAIDRLFVNPRGEVPQALAVTGAAERSGNILRRMVVKEGGSVQIVPTEEIDAITAEGDYVAVHTAGRSLLKLQTISSMEKVLDPTRFIRVHRSAILNLGSLKEIVPVTKDTKKALLQNGQTVPVSREGHKLLMKRLEA